MRHKFSTLLFITIALHVNAQGGFSNSKKLTSIMSEVMTESDVPAVIAIAVNANGQRISYSFGKAVWGASAKVTETHIFRIYSMTKLLTSVAAMQLVERGKVCLDDDLSPLMPSMAKIPILNNGKLVPAKKAITLRHLLSHSSGFGFELTDAELASFIRNGWTHEELPRRFESGTQFLYGTSTNWVGKLIEKLSGLSLEEYFRRNITGPLGMSRTWYNLPDSLKGYVVSRGWRGTDGNQPLSENSTRIPTKDVKIFPGSTGLFSTPKDYTILLQCLLNKGCWNNIQILAAGTIDEMISNQIGDITLDVSKNYYSPGSCCNLNGIVTPNDKWGLAWLIDNDSTYYGRKTGTVLWGGLLNTYFYIDYKSGVAATIFTQYLPFNDPATHQIFDRFSAFVFTGN